MLDNLLVAYDFRIGYIKNMTLPVDAVSLITHIQRFPGFP